MIQGDKYKSSLQIFIYRNVSKHSPTLLNLSHKMSLSFIEEVMLCSMFLKFFLILRPVTCTGTQLACGQEPLTSTLILCAYTPLYSDPSWRKAPYGPTEPATNRLLSPGGKIPTRRQSVRKNSAHVEFFSRKGCRLLPGRKVSTVSLAR